jgi:hypothetical protein
MSALATLGSLTVVSVQSSLKTSTSDRAAAIAMYAAESGAAVAMDYLRSLKVPPGPLASGFWDPRLSPAPPGNPVPLPFPSNGALPGSPNYLLDPLLNASYSVVLFNNREAPPGGPLNDRDWRLIIRSTGSGPQGSVAILEWEVEMTDSSRPFVLLGFHVAL